MLMPLQISDMINMLLDHSDLPLCYGGNGTIFILEPVGGVPPYTVTWLLVCYNNCAVVIYLLFIIGWL